MDIDSWYRHRLMVLTTPMELIQTHGIVLELLNHTRTKGISFARMQDFFFYNTKILLENNNLKKRKLEGKKLYTQHNRNNLKKKSIKHGTLGM